MCTKSGGSSLLKSTKIILICAKFVITHLLQESVCVMKLQGICE